MLLCQETISSLIDKPCGDIICCGTCKEFESCAYACYKLLSKDQSHECEVIVFKDYMEMICTEWDDPDNIPPGAIPSPLCDKPTTTCCYACDSRKGCKVPCTHPNPTNCQYLQHMRRVR